MPRPKGQQKAVLSTKVPQSVYDAFDARASSLGINKATLLAQLAAAEVGYGLHDDGEVADRKQAEMLPVDQMLTRVDNALDRPPLEHFDHNEVAGLAEEPVIRMPDATGIFTPPVDPAYEVVGGKGTKHKHVRGEFPTEVRDHPETGVRQERYLCKECGATLPWRKQ